jgi:hypothetical protein
LLLSSKEQFMIKKLNLFLKVLSDTVFLFPFSYARIQNNRVGICRRSISINML